MNAIISSRKVTAAVSLSATLLLFGGSPARAEEDWHRKGIWEIYGSGQYLIGDTVDYSKFGVRIDIDDTALFGLGAGYHITDHWAVSLDILGGQTDFNSTGMQLALSEGAFVIGSNLNVEYNFLRRRFSPLVRAGAGFYNFSDLDLYAGVTHDETDFACNVGGGLRWNVTDHLVLKLVGGVSWTDLKDSSSIAQFGFVTLSIGASF